MTSHELARALLALSDKPVLLIIPQEGGYTADYAPYGGPWEDPFGSVRIQIEQPNYAIATSKQV